MSTVISECISERDHAMRKLSGVLVDRDLQNGVRVAREKPGFDSDPYFDLTGEGEGEMGDTFEVSKM